MNLIFKRVESDGFQSFGEMSFDIRNLGTTVVKGINNYEDKASSNGSGKSSIFEMIYFALFGKTTKGISEPTNRYLNRGYYVRLLFTVDGADYEIIRANKHKKYKTALILKKGEEDISCRNKSDTDKMIKNDIIKISSDVFLSTIYLAQGFDGRISLLSPSGRKERLEEITNTSEKIEEFKNKLSTAKSELTSEVTSLEQSYSREEGSILTLKNQLESTKTSINEIPSSIDASQIDILKAEVEGLYSSMEILNDKRTSVISDIMEVKKDLSTINFEVEDLKSKMVLEKNNKKNLLEGKPCPTCKRPMLDKIPEEVINSIDDKIREFAQKLFDKSSIVVGFENKYKELEDSQTKLNNDYTEKKLEYTIKKSELDSVMQNSQMIEKLEYLKKQVLDIKEEIDKKSLNIESIKKDLDVVRAKYDIVSHCLLLVTKQYRNYLLTEIVSYLNTRLEKYSSLIFSNDEKINLVADDTKLNIFLSDAQYESLSGGEKKKVDIALVLAQRDLALDISDLTCNVLIFDEIFDGLDSKSLLSILELLNSISDNYESLFIISHIIDLALPYDTIVTVEKNTERVSSIITA